MIGPLLPYIIDDFRLSHATASLLVSIPDVLMGALALPTPWLARRFGRDAVILTALFILFMSIVLRAFSGTTTELLATTAGVGAGIAIAGALVGGFIKARFPTRAALFMGLYATSLLLGSTMSAALSGPIAPATMPFVAVACCAFGLGGAFTLGMTLPLDKTDSVDETDVWNAFVLTVAYIIAATDPLISGYLRDINGGFRPSFILLAAVAVVMLSVTLFLRPHRHKA